MLKPPYLSASRARRRTPTRTIRPGRQLLDAVAAAMADRGETRIAARPVECLSVCKRPCTVALAAPGKWTYVVGDLNAPTNIDDIISAALAFAASDTGIVPWRDRPKVSERASWRAFRRSDSGRRHPHPGLSHAKSGHAGNSGKQRKTQGRDATYFIRPGMKTRRLLRKQKVADRRLRADPADETFMVSQSFLFMGSTSAPGSTKRGSARRGRHRRHDGFRQDRPVPAARQHRLVQFITA